VLVRKSVFLLKYVIFLKFKRKNWDYHIHGHHEKMAESVRFLPGTQVVEIRYEDLLDETKDLGASIKVAYGFDGLGILVVSGVPGIEEKRAKTLPLAQKFANLSDEIKEKMVHKESFYSFGWSHGKEMMKKGVPDFSKGSYYFNPEYDVPFESKELQEKYPPFCHPNIWPREDLPELEHACKDLGQLVVKVGKMVALQCDKYVHSVYPDYPPTKLRDIIATSRVTKARLLHYFPLKSNTTSNGDAVEQGMSIEEAAQTWCGFHNDHGSLTGLVPAMYLNPKGEEVPCPDPKAGLYIKSRKGDLVRVSVPKNCLAFQIGETACIHSGGLLQATPHAVAGATGPQSVGISRETLAVFMEPRWDGLMNLPKGAKEEDVVKGSSSKFLPQGVPLLGTRWKPDMDFGSFTDITLKSYYT
jgi:isopenicillin N synthase-like dioxygenase